MVSVAPGSVLTAAVAAKTSASIVVDAAIAPATFAADLASATSLVESAAKELLGADSAQQAEVKTWLDALTSGFDTAALSTQLNALLASRTYLAGYSFTLADAAAYVALRGADVSSAPAVKRWQGLVEATLPLAAADKALAAPSSASAPAAQAASAPAASADGSASAAAPAKAKKEKGPAGGDPSRKPAPKAAAAAASGAADSPAASKNAGGGGDSGSMPALEGAEEGKVVTRFPPEPSGYLHIGHVKAVLLNDFYARHYKGKLIIRFDDTNPSKEKDEFEQNIIQDLAALGVKGDFVSHTSDYFDLITEYAREMIRNGKAFMDDTPQEQMREERTALIDSKHRGMSVEECLAKFEGMLKGGEEGSKWCMRAKINMQDDNGTLRDPVLFRVNETPHHRTGTKYKAYPTYDFACPIVDSIEGVTHALRTNEYHDRNAQYEWIQTALGVRPVKIHEFSRLNFVYTLLSKRKLTWFADNGYVEGWFDPRFPTVQGVLRRGLVLPALKEFILGQGASKRVLDMEWDKFWAINKKHIDSVAPRYTALNAANKVLVNISGPGTPSGVEVRTAQLHPKNADVGSKAVFFADKMWLEYEDVKAMKEGEEVTLMKWGNAIIRKINKATNAADGTESITSVDAELHLDGDFKKTEKKVTWLASITNDVSASGAAASSASSSSAAIPVVLNEFDYLITVPKLEEGDDFMAAINKTTKIETRAVGEPAMRDLKTDDIIQVERKGYFRVDKPYLSEERPLVLFAIPDGRQKSWGVGSPAFVAAAEAKKKADKAAGAASNAAGAAAGPTMGKNKGKAAAPKPAAEATTPVSPQ